MRETKRNLFHSFGRKIFFFKFNKACIQCRLVKELTICPKGGILYPLSSDKIARNIKKIILASLSDCYCLS